MASQLLSAIRHRGPDDEGVLSPSANVTLVNTRLAILDLSSAGHQPMSDPPREGRSSAWVIFNGEIYNFRELERQLSSDGFDFRTRTDTEVILASYRRWGGGCVERLRGMFAICIADPDLGLAWLYRDRLGIKPLYIYRPPSGGLVFASELRAILALGSELVDPVVNSAALESFFAQGAVQGEASLVKGIELLAPATALCVDLENGRELKHRTYWHLPANSEPTPVRAGAIEQLGALARDAVKMHLVSDAPLGLFLSGGVDSAALLALATDVEKTTIRTLTVGFDSAAFDESAESRATAAAFAVDNQTIELSAAEILGGLDGGLAAMDQPTVDGLNTYFVSRAAREAGLTVALSGLGGDELFGGYASFLDVPRAVALRRSAFKSACARLGGSVFRTRFGAKLAETLNRPPEMLAMYLLRRELFLPGERRTLHPLPEGADAMTGLDCAMLDHIRTDAGKLDEINRVSLFEIRLYLRHMLLRDADGFSMAAPIEYRVPYLDHELVEAVFALPGAWKRPDPRPKPLLLDLVGSRLPEQVARRRKRGFTFPWGEWFRDFGPLGALARDAAYDSATWRGLAIVPSAVSAIWQRFVSGDRAISPLQLLAFVALRDYAVRNRLRAA